jgi:hypothetical protein
MNLFEDLSTTFSDEDDILFLPPGCIHAVISLTASAVLGYYVTVDNGKDQRVMLMEWEREHIPTIKARNPSELLHAIADIDASYKPWQTLAQKDEFSHMKENLWHWQKVKLAIGQNEESATTMSKSKKSR